MLDLKQKLLTPYQLSPNIKLKNRIVMAPLTRRYATMDGCATELMAAYYARRAEAGLIITEGTLISQDAIGYGNVPGIYTKKQIKAWQKVTDSVHKNNGVIFLQLWHCGRVSHPKFHNGKPPISASVTTMNSPLGHSGLSCEKSRAASKQEIQALIDDYATAAQNAITAGFDGVEIHGANGYLIDQFLHYCTNLRTDNYGSLPENMSRFCLEVFSACCAKVDAERVGLRLSPGGHMAEIVTDGRDKFIFAYLLKQLSKTSIAYIHMGNFDDSIRFEALENLTMTEFARKNFSGNLITAGGYNYQKATNGINNNKFDLIAFGRPFIANSDLINKIENNIQWVNYNKEMLNNLY